MLDGVGIMVLLQEHLVGKPKQAVLLQKAQFLSSSPGSRENVTDQ